MLWDPGSHLNIASTSSNEYSQHVLLYRKSEKNIAYALPNMPLMDLSADVSLKCALIRWIFNYKFF